MQDADSRTAGVTQEQPSLLSCRQEEGCSVCGKVFTKRTRGEMKIVILQHMDFRIEVIDVPEPMVEGSVEHFLRDHGYQVSLLSWTSADTDVVPVRFHTYSFDDRAGEEVVRTRNIALRNDDSRN